MKIIIIGTAYPYRGGLSAYNERLAEEFVREGHEVEIQTFTLQYPKFLFPGKTQFSSDPAPKNLKIVRKINSINPFNWFKVGREIRKKRPDLVIIKFWLPFMSLCFGKIARLLHKNEKTKVVSILDNLIPHEKRIGDRILISYFVKSVDAFVAMSRSVLADIDIFNKQKPRIFSLHPIYDYYGNFLSKKEALEKINLPLNHNYILFFGFIRNYKGLDLLLESFSNKKLQELNVKLIVAGEFYENQQKYLDIINKHNLTEYVILRTDFIPDSEVAAYFCAADLIVQPYRSATQSGVTQIAYYFEKPMLVTNVGGLAEIVPHNKAGYVVEPNSENIAVAIIDFYLNNRSAEMIENVKIEKRKFGWDKMSNAILSLAAKINK